MNVSTIAVAVGLAAFSACSSPPTLPPATEACLTGWWHGLTVACSLECPGQPECDAGDCQAFDYLGFDPDKTSWSGSLSVSMSTKRISSFGPRDRSTWSLSDGGLALRPGGTPVEARCNATRLDLGLVTNTKYDPALAAALERMKGTQAFSSESF